LDSNPAYDINKPFGRDGNTLLIIASQKGYTDIVKVLLDKGAEVDRPDSENFTALHAASEKGNADIVKMLLDKGANVNYLNGGIFTALYIASEVGNADIVKMLLDKGADVNSLNDEKFTALYIASINGYADIVKMLLDKGADVNYLNGGIFTALYVASENGHADIVKMLLDKGADVNFLNNEKFTTLYIASEVGNADIVKMLLDKGANVNYLNDEKFTALYIASEKGYVDVVKLLLDRGADVNSVNNGKFTALYIASEKGHADIVKILLDKGADVNYLNNGIFTALYIASEVGNADIVKMLLDKGANVNYLNDGKFTALYIASVNRHADIVKILLDKGADVNYLNNGKFTALYIASEKGHVDVVKLLLEKGANVNIVIKGKSILDKAKSGEFIPEINELIKRESAKPYTGITRPDIEKFNIFLAVPDYPPSPTEEQKKTAEENAKKLADNTSLCPVCLSYSERSMGCLYMHHTCPEELRHQELYKKYKGSDGHIWWCTDCGRICTGHKHHALGYSGGDVPKLLLSSNPFSKKCSLTEGGGSLEEKLRRISRMIEFYADLQVSIQEGGEVPSEEEVRDMVIEETWNGALVRTLVNPQTVKRWKTSLDVFPSGAPPPVTVVAPLVVPPGVYEEPKIETGSCSVSLDDNVPVVQFRHKNAAGQMFDHVHDEEKRFICKSALIEHLRTSGGDSNGKCYDVDCGGYLWPPEVRKAFELFGPLTPEDETLLKNYEERFPRTTLGGARKLPSLNAFLRPLNNEKCYLKNGGKRTYKKRRSNKKTRKVNV